MIRRRITETMTEWLDLGHATGRFSDHTVANYRLSLQRFVDSQGDMVIAEISRQHAKDWMRTFAGLAPSTVCGRIAAMSSFFDELVAEEHCEANPFAGLKRPKNRTVNVRHPAPAEALERCMKAGNHRDRAMLALAGVMGLRRMEIAKVAESDFDWASKTLSVVGKGQKLATLPVPDSVLVLVRVWIAAAEIPPGGWLFPSRDGQHLSAQRTGELILQASQRAGFRITAHQWRHRAGTDVAHAFGVKAAQELLRHSSSATTDVYIQPNQELLRRALEELHDAA